MTKARLLTIPISHYCEKARWALDRAGIPFDEEAHLQVFHYRHVKRAGGGRSVPALVTGTAAGTLADSTDILRWADVHKPGSIYPSDPKLRREAEELEDHLDVSFGPATRRVIYKHVLPRRDLGAKYNCTGVPSLERRLFPVFYPFAKLFLRRHLHIDDKVVAADIVEIRHVFDDVRRRLAHGPFLIGDSFSAADLTFAALAAPMVLPDEYGVPLPRLEEIPPLLHELVLEFRAHEAGRFALRMFREERVPPRRATA